MISFCQKKKEGKEIQAALLWKAYSGRKDKTTITARWYFKIGRRLGGDERRELAMAINTSTELSRSLRKRYIDYQ